MKKKRFKIVGMKMKAKKKIKPEKEEEMWKKINIVSDIMRARRNG